VSIFLDEESGQVTILKAKKKLHSQQCQLLLPPLNTIYHLG